MLRPSQKLVGILAAGLLFAAPVAFAADSNVGNSNTGKNSLNRVEVTTENETSVVTNNNADVDSDISVKADTGGNKIGNNEIMDNHESRCDEESNPAGDKSITTGNATAQASVTNNVNSTEVNVEEEREAEEQGEEAAEEVAPAEASGVQEAAEVAPSSAGGVAAAAETLPESGANSYITPLVLASIVTFLSFLKYRKMFPSVK